MTRTRTYTWDDPAATSGALPTMAGVVGPDGRLYAQGTTTCLILRGER